MSTMRFPKWLLEENFTLYYDPKRNEGPFKVFVWIDPKRVARGSIPGFGNSIAEAAKAARIAREAEKK